MLLKHANKMRRPYFIDLLEEAVTMGNVPQSNVARARAHQVGRLQRRDVRGDWLGASSSVWSTSTTQSTRVQSPSVAQQHLEDMPVVIHPRT